MPANYTGSAAGRAVTDPVTVSNPIDGEQATAASNSAAIAVLADFLKFILDSAGFLAVARTWSALQTFSAGLSVGGGLSVTGVANTVLATIAGYTNLDGGSNPACTTDTTHYLTKKTAAKAWGAIYLTGSTANGTNVIGAANDCLNIATATHVFTGGKSYVDVTFHRSFTQGRCLLPALITDVQGTPGRVGYQWTANNVVRLQPLEDDGTPIDLTAVDTRTMALTFALFAEV